MLIFAARAHARLWWKAAEVYASCFDLTGLSTGSRLSPLTEFSPASCLPLRRGPAVAPGAGVVEALVALSTLGEASPGSRGVGRAARRQAVLLPGLPPTMSRHSGATEHAPMSEVTRTNAHAYVLLCIRYQYVPLRSRWVHL